MLIEVIANPELPPRQIVLPNQLIVRASCGAVQLSTKN
jgi:DNA-binding LacI/PurR family transcriptional regulator